jgi:hypothetical protein
MASVIMMLLIWNSKQLHAALLALGTVCLGGTPTGAGAGHPMQIRPSLPEKIQSAVHLQLQRERSLMPVVPHWSVGTRESRWTFLCEKRFHREDVSRTGCRSVLHPTLSGYFSDVRGLEPQRFIVVISSLQRA